MSQYKYSYQYTCCLEDLTFSRIQQDLKPDYCENLFSSMVKYVPVKCMQNNTHGLKHYCHIQA